MRATITVYVSDDFLAERVAEFNRQKFGGPPETVESYFAGRLAEICSDELRVALYDWPAKIEHTVAGA